ncbi:hypothetical protein BDV93DRAFT_519345 [Ceratobasidium sp. AG-I]|nr:hypothetical protein BDV93DRAFT_519345 [Ceratobasidium sp. AG-I]
MISYERLPPECFLQILGFLSLPDVAILLRTSKLWNSVISKNEATVYAKLAYNHGFVSVYSPSLGTARRGWISSVVNGTQTWKAYCLVLLNSERRWEGNERAHISPDLFGFHQRVPVHRFKVDTDKQLLTMTGGSGGSLVVHCLQNPGQPALFELSKVKPYAHVEMSKGFVVFTCDQYETMEVWRWAVDQVDDPVHCEPETGQMAVYEAAMKANGYSAGSSPNRGELIPVGMLYHPRFFRALRLVYPTLCVGSAGCDYLWLWDIRTLELVQTIELAEKHDHMFRMNYVDVNETHAFVATDLVSVYSRATGQCVFRLSSIPELVSLFRLRWQTPSLPPGVFLDEDSQAFVQMQLPPYRGLGTDTSNYDEPGGSVAAVHVSPSGQDFVAIGYDGHLFHVRNFDTSARDSRNDNETHSSEYLRVSLTRLGNSSLSQLAYDGERIVVSGPNGVCILALDEPEEQSNEVIDEGDVKSGRPKLYPIPVGLANFVPPFGSRFRPYMHCSCLQITREGFWIAWPGIGRPRKTIGMIDFTRPRDAATSATRIRSAWP